MRVRRWFQVCAAMCLVLVLAGCAANQDLAFEIIDSSDTAPGVICEDEPGLFVITRPEEIPASELERLGRGDLSGHLRALDYGRHFAVAVCRGVMPAGNPSLIPDVRRITRDGDKVVIRAHFRNAKAVLSKEDGEPAYGLPYQLAVVTKEGAWGQEVHFVLEVDGKEVQERTYFVP